MGKLTLIEKIKKSLKEKIANISWQIFLWAIDMTAEKYWYEIYRLERNRMCIENRPGVIRHSWYCDDCDHKWRDGEKGACPECGSDNVSNDDVVIEPKYEREKENV